MNDRSKGTAAVPAPVADLLVAAGRERTVLASGFLAGMCVFVAPLAILAIILLLTYVISTLSDGDGQVATIGRTLDRSQFQAVFAPVVNEAPLFVTAGFLGALLAQFRRWLARRAEPATLRLGLRPFLSEFILLYMFLVAMGLTVAATHGGALQLGRLWNAAPSFLLFMVAATPLAHTMWSYCFRNIIDLIASGPERAAATALRSRLLGSHGHHA